MLSTNFIKSFDKGGLQRLLLLIFLALGIPTAVLIWQAYGQLKWEAYHQHRGAAEELTERIDARLHDLIVSIDAQKFGVYAFLVVSGDPSANFVQRSPLSVYPIEDDVPGALGYFQVDSKGVFSSPLLPPDGTEADTLGIGDVEFEDRQRSASELQSVLADNRLLRTRGEAGLERRLSVSGVDSSSPIAAADDLQELEETVVLKNTTGRNSYRQDVFSDLNQPQRQVSHNEGKSASADLAIEHVDESSQATVYLNSIGKVSDIKLDVDLQKKSETAERKNLNQQLRSQNANAVRGRSKRRENTALPESSTYFEKDKVTNIPAPTDIRISTFESEIDPFEFSLLDSGHFVLFRNVWRNSERYVQGVLVDQDVFVRNVFGERFMETALSDMSSLIIAYQDDVIFRQGGGNGGRYSSVMADFDGELLYRSRFAAPFDKLDAIFSLKHLPAGPGASVLGWVILVLVIVFAGGFLTLYRLGLSQISLARQQQDFVSAVSHELKSPLTSIRMYGEMLKEGWADEEKRQSYYEFIHDESERLSRLISNVLQLASITRNEPQFDISPVSVAKLMSDTESKISSQIERAGFELKMDRASNADDIVIDIDEDCFAQIVINLVDNAIKFSKNASRKVIEIRSQLTQDGQVQFSVRDYGPGVPKDQMKKIFQLFYRTESELTRETIGTGIGLAIVHQLTAAMDGSIDLVTANPGTEFYLRFPVPTR